MAVLILRTINGGIGNTAKGAPLTHTELDQNFINIDVALDTKADIASPALTGAPTAPTAPTGTSTNRIATTAFVNSAAIMYAIALG